MRTTRLRSLKEYTGIECLSRGLPTAFATAVDDGPGRLNCSLAAYPKPILDLWTMAIPEFPQLVKRTSRDCHGQFYATALLPNPLVDFLLPTVTLESRWLLSAHCNPVFHAAAF